MEKEIFHHSTFHPSATMFYLIREVIWSQQVTFSMLSCQLKTAGLANGWHCQKTEWKREKIVFFFLLLCQKTISSSVCVIPMAPAPTRHAHHGCWVTPILTLLTPLLPLSPQPRGLGASCSCWFLDSFTSLCLASRNFHQLCNQFPVLNILYFK